MNLQKIKALIQPYKLERVTKEEITVHPVRQITLDSVKIQPDPRLKETLHNVIVTSLRKRRMNDDSSSNPSKSVAVDQVIMKAFTGEMGKVTIDNLKKVESKTLSEAQVNPVQLPDRMETDVKKTQQVQLKGAYHVKLIQNKITGQKYLSEISPMDKVTVLKKSKKEDENAMSDGKKRIEKRPKPDTGDSPDVHKFPKIMEQLPEPVKNAIQINAIAVAENVIAPITAVQNVASEPSVKQLPVDKKKAVIEALKIVRSGGILSGLQANNDTGVDVDKPLFAEKQMPLESFKGVNPMIDEYHKEVLQDQVEMGVIARDMLKRKQNLPESAKQELATVVKDGKEAEFLQKADADTEKRFAESQVALVKKLKQMKSEIDKDKLKLHDKGDVGKPAKVKPKNRPNFVMPVHSGKKPQKLADDHTGQADKPKDYKTKARAYNLMKTLEDPNYLKKRGVKRLSKNKTYHPDPGDEKKAQELFAKLKEEKKKATTRKVKNSSVVKK